MFTVYILYSTTYGKTYVGFTSNLLARYSSHNHASNNGWTRLYTPWLVAYCEYFDTKGDAVHREKELKTGKGREWIKLHLDEWISVFG